MKIKEIFYSIQGEGMNAGVPMLFVRFAGCPVQKACMNSGVLCDTQFEGGKEFDADGLLKVIEHAADETGAEYILLTGGEPMAQLRTIEGVEFVSRLKGSDHDFVIALETSGAYKIEEPNMFDHITVSPKVAEHVLKKHFTFPVHELRYVIHEGDSIPITSIPHMTKFLSPHTHGNEFDPGALETAIELVKKNPDWRLSVQAHKLWNQR